MTAHIDMKKIVDGVSTAASAASSHATSAVQWLGRSVVSFQKASVAMGKTLTQQALKVMQFCAPHLRTIGEFAKEHRSHIITAAVAAALGAATYAVLSLLCKEHNDSAHLPAL